MMAPWFQTVFMGLMLACFHKTDGATTSKSHDSFPSQFSRFLSLQPIYEANATGNFKCGETIKEFTSEDLKQLTERAAASLADANAGDLIRSLLIPNMNYGIRYIKICSSCQAIAEREDIMESIPEKTGDDAFDSYCAPTAYGYNTTMSGLLIVPIVLNSNNESYVVKPGPIMAAVWGHSSETRSQKAPSTEGESELPSWDYAASTGVAASIAPDYVGYGESYKLYKSYVVKRAYQTASVPLWFAAKDYIAQQSNCTTELLNVAIVGGYSEGGYSAVAMSASLHKVGVDVTSVFAGAGPYQTASQLLTSTTRNVDDGVFPLTFKWALALWAASYSSTNPSVANFGTGQDLLDENFTSASNVSVQDWFVQGFRKAYMNELIPDDDPLVVFRQELIDIVRDGIAANEPNITCYNPRYATDKRVDKLCEALLENDLLSIIESTPYPIVFCHSPDDTLVSIQNVPDIVHDSTMLQLREVRGTHSKGAVQQCTLFDLLYLSSAQFLQQSLFMSDDHDSVCQRILNATTEKSSYNETADDSTSTSPSSFDNDSADKSPSTSPSSSDNDSADKSPSTAPSSSPSISPLSDNDSANNDTETSPAGAASDKNSSSVSSSSAASNRRADCYCQSVGFLLWLLTAVSVVFL